RHELSRARTETATATAQAESLARRREDAERRLAKVSEELDQAVDRQKDLERESRRTSDTLAQLKQTRLDLGAQTEGFAARREALAEQVHEGEAQVETLRTEAHRRRSRLVSLVEIQERYEGFARGTRTVMQQSGMIARGEGTIRGLVADVVRAPETLELAVEAALGDRLGGVLVDDHDVGVAAIGYLKAQAAGRSAFVPMSEPAAVMRAARVGEPGEEWGRSERSEDSRGSAHDEPGASPYHDSNMLATEASAESGAAAEPGATDSVATDVFAGDDLAGAPSWETAAADSGHRIVVEDHTAIHAAAASIGGEGVLGRLVDLVGFADGYEAVGQSLFGDCVVVESLDRAVQLHKAGAPGTLVTLEGDIVDERGVVSGGSREAQGGGVLAQKREIRELEQIVDSLDRELTEATARLVTAKAEHKQLDRALEGLRTQAHEGDLAIMGHEKDAGRLRAELERLRERAGHLTAERNELEERLAAAARELEQVAARKADAEQRMDHFEKE
ncbi:MAG: hypothetical protein K8M05_33065, partial [Deltaproteobacteria bacterium]|nr:hypothetical protein [Kofleriaceae bacterium]